jgi:hypothetical protein
MKLQGRMCRLVAKIKFYPIVELESHLGVVGSLTERSPIRLLGAATLDYPNEFAIQCLRMSIGFWILNQLQIGKDIRVGQGVKNNPIGLV